MTDYVITTEGGERIAGRIGLQWPEAAMLLSVGAVLDFDTMLALGLEAYSAPQKIKAVEVTPTAAHTSYIQKETVHP